MAAHASATSSRPFRLKLRLAAWVVLVVALVAGSAGWMASLSGDTLLQTHTPLYAGWLALSAAVVGLFLLLVSTPANAIRLRPRPSKRLILILTGLLQIPAVFFVSPVLSEDPLRYRLDGKTWLLGLSPYATSPLELARTAEATADPGDRLDALDAAVRYPELETIYLPVSQAVFVMGRTVEYLLPGADPRPPARLYDAPVDARPQSEPLGPPWRSFATSLPWHQQLIELRVIFALALVLTTGELIAWLRDRKQSPWWAALFAWSPLVLLETGGMGHQDILGVLFLVGALRRMDIGRYRRGAMCLAAAVAVKPLALVVLPFMIRQALRRPVARETQEKTEEPTLAGKRAGPVAARRLSAWFALTLVLLFVPAVSAHGGWEGLSTTMGRYVGDWEANGLLHRTFHLVFSEDLPPSEMSPEQLAHRETVKTAARLTGGVIVAVVAIGLWLGGATPVGAGYGIMLAALLVSPVAYPWYLIWPLALVPIGAASTRGRFGLAVLLWSGTSVLSYALWHTQHWRLPWDVLLWQYVPVYVAVMGEVILHFTGSTLRPLPLPQSTPTVTSKAA